MSLPIASRVATVFASPSSAVDGEPSLAPGLIRGDDKVLILGRPGRRCHPGHAMAAHWDVDHRIPSAAELTVLWVGSDSVADQKLLPIVDEAGRLRMIIIENADTSVSGPLYPLLKALRFRGFLHETREGASVASVIISRPDWLRLVR